MIMKDLNKKIDLRLVLAGFAAILLGVGTVTGTVQQVISFADPINEMLFTLVSLKLGGICLLTCKKDFLAEK